MGWNLPPGVTPKDIDDQYADAPETGYDVDCIELDNAFLRLNRALGTVMGKARTDAPMLVPELESLAKQMDIAYKMLLDFQQNHKPE
jgi:hypothetical protein